MGREGVQFEWKQTGDHSGPRLMAREWLWNEGGIVPQCELHWINYIGWAIYAE